jgi:hypothetical protein
VYNQLFRFEYISSWDEDNANLFKACEGTVNNVENVQQLQALREGLPKVPETEVCFKACRDPSTDLDSSSVALYGDDDRPVCADLPA